MGRLVIAAAAFSLMLAHVQAEEIRTYPFASWRIGSYTNDRTGQFSHCAASAEYKHGTSLFVSVAADFSWMLAFSNSTWRMQPGDTVPIRLNFQGFGWIDVNGTVLAGQLLRVGMPENSVLLRAFRESRLMNANLGGVQRGFALDGTSRLLPELVDCVKRERGAAPKPPGQPDAASKQNPGVDEERRKLLNEALNEHTSCMHQVMREIVPYSSESAEILAQVAITRCAHAESKVVSLGTALYGASKAEVERIVKERLEQQKKEMVAEIVTFRAELAKSLVAEPKDGGAGKKTERDGI